MSGSFILQQSSRTLRSTIKMTRHLNQSEAIRLDEELFNECHFGIEQLMELAGLSCATAIAEVYPISKNVLVVSGPGNNGGDGLVCARHLKVFGYSPQVYCPKFTTKTLYKNLSLQCEFFGIPFLTSCPELNELNLKYSLVVDAMFGFSYKPPIRDEFKEIMQNMIQMTTPCCSIDIPSGWHVDEGPLDEEYLKPEMLISLSAPKLCAKYFKGRYHYLGGRFIPPHLLEKYNLELMNYPSTHSHLKLSTEVETCIA